jgi:hypothetical protein
MMIENKTVRLLCRMAKKRKVNIENLLACALNCFEEAERRGHIVNMKPKWSDDWQVYPKGFFFKNFYNDRPATIEAIYREN